jgi:hypothetical protein
MELDNQACLRRTLNITGEWDWEIANVIHQRMGPG